MSMPLSITVAELEQVMEEFKKVQKQMVDELKKLNEYQRVVDEFKKLNEYQRRIYKKETMNEMRLMCLEMKPHELLRMICNVLNDFDVSGDVLWPLRQIRDLYT